MEAIIFVGIQASGKSTFYLKEFFNSHMLKTRNRELILLNACISAKQSFVVDNTNPTIEERKKYINATQDIGFSVKCYYFQSNIQDCLKRNQERKGSENIPEVGVKGTYNKLELPSYKEGFTELFYVSLKNDEFIVKEWENEI